MHEQRPSKGPAKKLPPIQALDKTPSGRCDPRQKCECRQLRKRRARMPIGQMIRRQGVERSRQQRGSCGTAGTTGQAAHPHEANRKEQSRHHNDRMIGIKASQDQQAAQQRRRFTVELKDGIALQARVLLQPRVGHLPQGKTTLCEGLRCCLGKDYMVRHIEGCVWQPRPGRAQHGQQAKGQRQGQRPSGRLGSLLPCRAHPHVRSPLIMTPSTSQTPPPCPGPRPRRGSRAWRWHRPRKPAWAQAGSWALPMP